MTRQLSIENLNELSCESHCIISIDISLQEKCSFFLHNEIINIYYKSIHLIKHLIIIIHLTDCYQPSNSFI